MDENESLRPVNIPVDKPGRPTPYELLLRQSRKMGSLATKTYDVTRDFLKSDISVLHPDAILFGRRSGEETKKPIETLVEQSHQILADASTVILPHNLFPDSVVVDRTKVTITRRTFFWTSETISIRIEDILNVSCSVGPLFGSLTISSRVMNSTDHYEINYFWRKDAIHLKHIIQGYMIAMHNNTNVNDLTLNELVDTLDQLGHVS